MSKLFAISDLHVDYVKNKKAVFEIEDHQNDWLILAGDVSHRYQDLAEVLGYLNKKFKKIIWTPGNHDLWTGIHQVNDKGIDKYNRLVEICRQNQVSTPEDEYAVWEGECGSYTIIPMFLLYDYSFKPDHIPIQEAVQWAAETNIVCADEFYLDPKPYQSISEWCHQRVEWTQQRIEELPAHKPKILVTHFPLNSQLIRLYRIPRFIIWCGTQFTAKWHLKYNVEVVIYGHLHIRATDYLDGVRFEEVSLGNPGQWQPDKGINSYVRQILPDPRPMAAQNAGPFWHY